MEDKERTRQHLYYAKNRELILAKRRLYRVKNLDNRKTWLEANRNSVRKQHTTYVRRKRMIDLQYRLKNVLYLRVWNALRGSIRSGSAVRDLGCSIKHLKKHLEGQFQDGMTWENYGFNGWHIDHIVPLAFFDLSNKEQFLKACHYTNLQPLWAIENIKKGKKLIHT